MSFLVKITTSLSELELADSPMSVSEVCTHSLLIEFIGNNIQALIVMLLSPLQGTGWKRSHGENKGDLWALIPKCHCGPERNMGLKVTKGVQY